MFRKKSGVLLLQNIIHLIFVCGILRSFGLILKCCQTLVAKSEQLQAFKMHLGLCDLMSNYMLAQSLVLILK